MQNSATIIPFSSNQLDVFNTFAAVRFQNRSTDQYPSGASRWRQTDWTRSGIL